MIALVPRHGTKNPILGVLAHGLYLLQLTLEFPFIRDLIVLLKEVVILYHPVT